MIGETVAYLNGLIKVLGLTTQEFGITERETVEIRDGVATVPLAYVSGGEFEGIDYENRVCYHRLTGAVTRTETESETSGCSLAITQVAPMKLVCFFAKNIYNTDDANITFKVGNNLSNTISSSNIRSLATALQVDYVTVRVTNINTDKVSIFNEEFDGVEYAIPSELGLVSIDYEIEVSGDESCFLSYGCGDEELDITQLIIDEYCPTTETSTNVLIVSYTSTAATTQTFADFIGYDLEDMYINLQGAGNMGHRSDLPTARKLITGWDNTTGVMTFSQALPANWQITVIGTL